LPVAFFTFVTTPLTTRRLPFVLIRSGFFALLEKGTALVFALGTAMLLLRGLSKADFAAWGIFLIVTYFIDMGRSGLLQNALLTFWAQYPTQRTAVASVAWWLSLAFSVVSGGLLWLGTDWLCRTWQVPQLAQVLPVFFVTNFVAAALYHCNFVQQANQEFRGIFWSTFCQRGCLFGWVVYGWLTGRPVLLFEFSVAMLVGTALGTLASWYYARPFSPTIQVPDFQWIKKYIAYGKYVLGTNLSTMFYKNIDKLVLGQVMGPAAFAVYDAAAKVTQMVEAPSFSIAAAVFPQSARSMTDEGPAGVQRLYQQSVAAILAIILPFVGVTLVAAEPIIRLFAGEGYAEAAGVLRLTAFFGLFMPFAVQFGTVLDSTGRPEVNFRYTLFIALLNLALSFWWVQRIGLYGAAVATLLTYAVGFGLMQHRLHRDYGIRWWRAFALVPSMYRAAWRIIRRKQ
jgi:lipopolysaccharide exporter